MHNVPSFNHNHPEVNSNIKCTNVEFSIRGVVTHYERRKPVKTMDGDPAFRTIKKKYKTPRTVLSFRANTDVDLIVGGMYVDPIGNKFYALTKNEIRNVESHVETFEIPQQLLFLYSTFKEI